MCDAVGLLLRPLYAFGLDSGEVPGLMRSLPAPAFAACAAPHVATAAPNGALTASRTTNANSAASTSSTAAATAEYLRVHPRLCIRIGRRLRRWRAWVPL